MPEVLNFPAFFCYSLSILSLSRNPTSTLLHLSGSQETLLCDLITLTHRHALLYLMTCTLAYGGVAIFVRWGLSFSELPPPLSHRLIPILTMWDKQYTKKSFPLSFLNIYAPPIPPSLADSRNQLHFSLCSPFFLKSLHSEGLQLSSSSLRLKKYFCPSWEKSIQLASSPPISFLEMTLSPLLFFLVHDSALPKYELSAPTTGTNYLWRHLSKRYVV